MSVAKLIAYFNLVGVLLMAALCAAQWETNRRLNLRVVELDHEREVQARKIEDQEKDLTGTRADLAELHSHLTDTIAARDAAVEKVKATTAERYAARSERDKALTAHGWTARCGIG